MIRKDQDLEPHKRLILPKRLENPQEEHWEGEISLSSSAMIFRLRHLTPGYFRLLQMQLASGSELESEDRLVNHLALLLAIMGLSLSYYSVRQLAEEIKPPPEPLEPATKQE